MEKKRISMAKEAIGKSCKKHLCKGKVPGGKSLESFACQILGVCRYCYRMDYAPRATSPKLPACRHGSERLLTPDERHNMERNQFEGMEQTIWTPEFYEEWMEYWGE